MPDSPVRGGDGASLTDRDTHFEDLLLAAMPALRLVYHRAGPRLRAKMVFLVLDQTCEFARVVTESLLPPGVPPFKADVGVEGIALDVQDPDIAISRLIEQLDSDPPAIGRQARVAIGIGIAHDA